MRYIRQYNEVRKSINWRYRDPTRASLSIHAYGPLGLCLSINKHCIGRKKAGTSASRDAGSSETVAIAVARWAVCSNSLRAAGPLQLGCRRLTRMTHTELTFAVPRPFRGPSRNPVNAIWEMSRRAAFCCAMIPKIYIAESRRNDRGARRVEANAKPKPEIRRPGIARRHTRRTTPPQLDQQRYGGGKAEDHVLRRAFCTAS
jgi:hypothetical protein